MKKHAHIYDQATSRLKLIESGSVGLDPQQWSHYRLLPLCRAIIVLLDEDLPPPVRYQGYLILGCNGFALLVTRSVSKSVYLRGGWCAEFSLGAGFPALAQLLIGWTLLLLPPPVPKTDSLDDEVQRRSAALVLTGIHDGLSSPISFDAIKSESLPLARDDICTIDSTNIVRVSLKVAVLFIAELQQKEEEAGSGHKRG